MKINLIGMILHFDAGRKCFNGAIIDENGKELDAEHSLDFMIMEYAKVKNGGDSSTVAVSKHLMNTRISRFARCWKLVKHTPANVRAAISKCILAWRTMIEKIMNILNAYEHEINFVIGIVAALLFLYICFAVYLAMR